MPPDLALLSTLIGSNYPCLELIFMVLKVFEPLKFDCISTISIISTQATCPVITNFRMEHPEIGGTNICSRNTGHMTNMTAMPIYGKKLKASSS